MTYMSGYHITDEIIDRVVELMRVIDPTKANREYCRAMLEYYKQQVVAGLRDKALNDPDAIEALADSYEKWLDQGRSKK